MEDTSAVHEFVAEVSELSAIGPLRAALGRLPFRTLEALCKDWLAGKSEMPDPTNVLGVADLADQVMGLTDVAVLLYDTGLTHLERHPELVAVDTGCADASLNLLGILYQRGQHDRLHSVALRAARMRIERDEQRVRLAWFLMRVREARLARTLFREAMAGNPVETAAQTGLPPDEVAVIGQQIESLVRLPDLPPKLPDRVRGAIRPTRELLLHALACAPLWNRGAHMGVHLHAYQFDIAQASRFESAKGDWERGIDAFEAGDHRLAVTAFSLAIQSMPAFAEAHAMLMRSWLALADPRSAEDAFRNADMLLGADFPEIRALHAEALVRLGDTDGAAVELLREFCVAGATEELQRRLLHVFLSLLPKSFDRGANVDARYALDGALAVSGRLVSGTAEKPFKELLASLLVRLEMVGPVIPAELEELTGLQWENIRGIRNSYTTL